jgi:hypothetical protein
MEKRKKTIILTGVLLTIFIFQMFHHLNFITAAETADEEDLSFEISGRMDIDALEMVGGNEMGLGVYQVGATKTWYQEPFISGGEFDLDRLDMDFDYINRPFFNTTTYQNISILDSMGNSSIYNSTEVPEYAIGSGEKSQLKVSSNYNYTYSENNVTSYVGNYGSSVGTVEDLNKTDNLSFNISSSYDHEQQYYLDEDLSNPYYLNGDGFTSNGAISDTLEDTGTYIESTASAQGTNSHQHPDNQNYVKGWPSTQTYSMLYQSPLQLDDSDDSYSGVAATGVTYGTWLEGGLRSTVDLPSFSYINVYSLRVRVEMQYLYDWYKKYHSFTRKHIYFKLHNKLTGSWDQKDWCYGQRGGSWSGSDVEFDITLTGYNIYKYASGGDIDIELRHVSAGNSGALLPALVSRVYVDRIRTDVTYYRELNLQLQTPNFEEGRVYLKMRSVYDDVTLIDNNGVNIYSGMKYYDGDYLSPLLGTAKFFDVSDLTSFRIYYKGYYDVRVEIWYCIIYNLQEKHRVDYDYFFDFEGQESIDNIYNVSIRYNASTSGVFNIEYGDSVNGYIQLGELDSTSRTTENFSFSYSSNEYETNVKITLLQFTDANPDIKSYNITIDEINITSVYQPFIAIHLVNFTYKVLGIEYKDNITCSFGDNYNYTRYNGTVDFFISTDDLTNYSFIYPMTIVEQNISLIFEIPFNITFTNISFRVEYSGIQWCSPTEYDFQLNGDDILPLGPKSAYLDILSNFPSSLTFTASQEIRFQMESETSFTFAKDLEIISRRVLRSSFTLESDHAILIDTITFAEDINPQSIWLNSIQYSYSGTNHSINPYIIMNVGETFILEVYLAEDIYKQLEYYYNSLGSGTFDLYLSGTTSDPFYDDVTKDNNFFIQLPSDFYLNWMDLQFSDLRYLPDYISNNTHDISDYGVYGPDVSSEDVAWRQYWYQTNGLAYKDSESGGSGYETIYSEDFDSLTGEMSLSSNPDYYNNTYDFGDNLTMINEFPNEFHEEDYTNWNLNSNSSITTSEYNNSQWEYTGNSYSISGQTSNPREIHWDGTYWWLLDDTGNVFKYNEEWVYQSETYDKSESSYFMGMLFDGTYWWLLGTSNTVFKYDTSWNYLSESHPTGITFSTDMFFDGIYWWLTTDNSVVRKYDTSWVYQSESYSIQDSARSIFFDGTYWNIASYGVSSTYYDRVYLYDTDWNFKKYYDIYTEVDQAQGIAFRDGLNWYAVDDSANQIVEYTGYSDIVLTSELNILNSSIIPSNSSFTMLNGTQVDNGTLGSLDDDYSTFNVSNGEGVFNATYSFTNEIAGQNPIDWVVDIEDSSTVNIISTLDGHDDLIEIYDYGSGTTKRGSCYNEFDDGVQTTGTIEFWTRRDGVQEAFYYEIFETSALSVGNTYLNHLSGNFESDGNILCAFAVDTWYHVKLEFDTTTDEYSIWIDGVPELTDWVMPTDTDALGVYRVYTRGWGSAGYYMYLDALGYSWDESYDIGDNLNPLWCSMNFNSTLQLENAESVLDIELEYAFKTDVSQEINISVYNFDNLNFDLINSSICTSGFYNSSFTLNSSHYNSSFDMLFNFEGVDTTTAFNFYLDLFNITYNYLSGDDIYTTLNKTIDFSFLNEYDVGFDNYQKLFNISIEFLYRFENYTAFNYTAYFNSSLLTKDSAWHNFSWNFEFNSTEIDELIVLFNVSNGILEVRNVNYTIKFNCLDIYNGTRLFQSLLFEPTFSIDYLQQINGNWILNYSMVFNPTEDYELFNFTNGINNSLLLIRTWILSESGWIVHNFSTNNSYSGMYSLNITSALLNNSKYEFLDFYIEYYFTGNPSNLTLDNLTLFDFDSFFYNVSECYIDDTWAGTFQNISLYWNASDRYISNVEINRTCDYLGIDEMIGNETLINNTLQDYAFNNDISGIYNLTMQFFDTYGNWELWAVNYTVIPSISISAGYQNPVFIGLNNTVSINILSSAPIIDIYYDNSTDYILEYNNDTYPIYDYEFNFTINYPVQTVYNVSIKVIDEYNDTYWINITDLCHIQRTTIMDIINLKSDYEQDDSVNLTVSLRDLYNQPIQNKIINYTIYDHSNITFVNTSSTTDVSGEIDIDVLLNTTWTAGFYHINCSFNDTLESYMGAWKLMSFEVLPITTVITNSSLINLTVNGVYVNNSQLTINRTEANSFDLIIDHEGTLTFDLRIENASLYINKTVDYSQYVNYDFIFSQKSSLFTFILFDAANLSNIPDNFTYLYFNNLRSINYNYDINRDELEIDDIFNYTYVNLDSFSIQLRYINNERTREQITERPRTDNPSVIFEELFLCDLAYKFWYFESSITINEIVELEHIRSGEIFNNEDFINDPDGKYKFDLSQKSEIYDVFSGTFDINPNYTISYSILSNNGTYSELTINYEADLLVNNVTIVLDLSGDSLWMSNWTNNASQSSSTFILEIPYMNFTTETQAISLYGNSSIPNSLIASYQVQETVIIDGNSHSYDYYGYISYAYYSEAYFLTGIDDDWTVDGVHYSSSVMTIQNNGYYECTGFDSSITGSYLKFNANPIAEYYVLDNEIDTLTIFINCTLPIDYAAVYFSIPSEKRYKIESDLEDLTSIGQILEEDFYFFIVESLDVGVNEITITYTIHTLADDVMLFIPLIFLIIAMVGMYYVMRRREIKKKLRKMSEAEQEAYLKKLEQEGGTLTQTFRSFKSFFRRDKNKKLDKKKKKKRKITVL